MADLLDEDYLLDICSPINEVYVCDEEEEELLLSEPHGTLPQTSESSIPIDMDSSINNNLQSANASPSKSASTPIEQQAVQESVSGTTISKFSTTTPTDISGDGDTMSIFYQIYNNLQNSLISQFVPPSPIAPQMYQPLMPGCLPYFVLPYPVHPGQLYPHLTTCQENRSDDKKYTKPNSRPRTYCKHRLKSRAKIKAVHTFPMRIPLKNTNRNYYEPQTKEDDDCDCSGCLRDRKCSSMMAAPHDSVHESPLVTTESVRENLPHSDVNNQPPQLRAPNQSSVVDTNIPHKFASDHMGLLGPLPPTVTINFQPIVVNNNYKSDQSATVFDSNSSLEKVEQQHSDNLLQTQQPQLVRLWPVEEKCVEEELKHVVQLFGCGQVVGFIPKHSSAILRFDSKDVATKFMKNFGKLRLKGKQINASFCTQARNTQV